MGALLDAENTRQELGTNVTQENLAWQLSEAALSRREQQAAHLALNSCATRSEHEPNVSYVGLSSARDHVDANF